MRFDTCNAVTHIDMTQTAFEVSTISQCNTAVIVLVYDSRRYLMESKLFRQLTKKSNFCGTMSSTYQLRLSWRSRQNSWKLCLPRNDCIIQEYVITVGRLSRWQYVCPTGVSIRMKLPSLEREMNLRSIPRYFSMLTTPHIPQDMFSIRSMLWCGLG